MRAGWSSEINQLTTGRALSDEFDGKILNPSGVEIDLPFWVFRRLKKLNLLERDRMSGRRRIRAHVFGLIALREGPDFRHDRRVRASDTGFQRACSLTAAGRARSSRRSGANAQRGRIPQVAIHPPCASPNMPKQPGPFILTPVRAGSLARTGFGGFSSRVLRVDSLEVHYKRIRNP